MNYNRSRNFLEVTPEHIKILGDRIEDIKEIVGMKIIREKEVE